MIPNPIRKVLSTMAAHQVNALLMGGQACVFYGAAEFSRDVDLAIVADAVNLDRLRAALSELKAQPVYVPPLSLEYLERGHAVHFRCGHPEADGLRIDLMSRMRGVAPFQELWSRRTTLEGQDGTGYQLMSLADLVRAKKTQRDKDWPMIQRLVEADYATAHGVGSEVQINFWLSELRTPQLLNELAARNPELTARLQPGRPLLKQAAQGDVQAVKAGLAAEEEREREADRIYWEPLKMELEALRHKSKGGQT